MFEYNVVDALDLNDAWRNTLWCCNDRGYDYTIKRGSYEGQIRRQLDYLTIVVNKPWTKPFNFYTPGGMPPPTTPEKINSYFYNYLITDTKVEGEDYTYGQFIAPQLPEVIKILKTSEGMTNQACITIGDVNSINLKDPPCLKLIDFKVVKNTLNMTVYFRSWDLFVGLPENLGGLQLLKEFVLMHLNGVEDGKLIAHSSGGHIYEMYFSIIGCLC